MKRHNNLDKEAKVGSNQQRYGVGMLAGYFSEVTSPDNRLRLGRRLVNLSPLAQGTINKTITTGVDGRT